MDRQSDMELGLAGIPAALATRLFRENPRLRGPFSGDVGTLRNRGMQRRGESQRIVFEGPDEI